MKLQKVVATIWVEGKKENGNNIDHPISILEDGTVKEPTWAPTGSCWYMDWSTSQQFTASVVPGIGGEADYITVYKNGEQMGSFSTSA